MGICRLLVDITLFSFEGAAERTREDRTARWSSGQDGGLSRRKREFDSPTGHHYKGKLGFNRRDPVEYSPERGPIKSVLRFQWERSHDGASELWPQAEVSDTKSMATKLVLIAVRVHPFPSRTRQLSSLAPKILGW